MPAAKDTYFDASNISYEGLPVLLTVFKMHFAFIPS